VFFTIFVTVALNRYWQYAAWYYDFGIFYSAISAVAQGREPIIDHFVFTGQNILGDHFHPIIFLVSPLVAIFKGGETLLVFQTLFVTLSGIFVYLVAKELLRNKVVEVNKIEAFSILIIYFAYIGLHNALITEFHEITLLPLPLMMFFYGMVKKHKWWYGLGLLGVLLTKESTFIIPAWFGLLIAWRNKGEWRKIGDLRKLGVWRNWQNQNMWFKIGLLTSVVSVLYGMTLVYAVFPAINGVGYRYLTETVEGANKVALLNDLKIKTVFRTFVSYGFLPLLAPETLPPVIFNWWSRFSSLATTRHDLGMHYNAEIAPTLILGTIYGWIRFKSIISFLVKNLNKKLNKIKVKFKKKYFNYLIILLAVCSLVFNIQILKSPFLLFTNKAFYAHSKNLKFLDDLIAHIPEDGVIMAQTNIAAKLAYRKVYMLREDYAKYDPDYIVIDERVGQEPNNFLGVGNFEELARNLAVDPRYELYYLSGDQKIYKKVQK
jgi:uncharacterized membrane protein